MINWDTDILHKHWKNKCVNLINPLNNELLAEVCLTPTDSTRRSFNTKIKKWHAQFPKDKEIAEYWLDRLTHGGLGSLISEGDAAHLKKKDRKCGCETK